MEDIHKEKKKQAVEETSTLYIKRGQEYLCILHRTATLDTLTIGYPVILIIF